MNPDNKDEMPKTAPLCRRRPEELWKSSKAPKEVWMGVNIATACQVESLSRNQLK
jgi:hypothetical protein